MRDCPAPGGATLCVKALAHGSRVSFINIFSFMSCLMDYYCLQLKCLGELIMSHMIISKTIIKPEITYTTNWRLECLTILIVGEEKGIHFSG